MSSELRRRTFVRGIGTVTAAGLLAGCSTETADGGDTGDGGGDGDGDGNGSGDGNDGDSSDQGSGDGGDGGASGPAKTVEAPGDVADYLSDTSNFDGSLVVPEGDVTVAVGATGNGGNFAFGPPGIQIETGTTVTWEWTGKGSGHNVVAEDGPFDSGAAVSEEGTTYSHTFEESGTYRYYCGPHKTLGMIGVVVVK